LNRKYDGPPSSFAFRCNLRHYSKVCAMRVSPDGTTLVAAGVDGSASVYKLDPLQDDLAPALIGVVFPGKPAQVTVGRRRLG